jgi:hypothetical protein
MHRGRYDAWAVAVRSNGGHDGGQNVDVDPVLVQYVGGNFATIFPATVAVAEPIWP